MDYSDIATHSFSFSLRKWSSSSQSLVPLPVRLLSCSLPAQCPCPSCPPSRNPSFSSLPCQLTKMFFLFPDPHFKEKNHRRRIISYALFSPFSALHALDAVDGRWDTTWNSTIADASLQRGGGLPAVVDAMIFTYQTCTPPIEQITWDWGVSVLMDYRWGSAWCIGEQGAAAGLVVCCCHGAVVCEVAFPSVSSAISHSTVSSVFSA